MTQLEKKVIEIDFQNRMLQRTTSEPSERGENDKTKTRKTTVDGPVFRLISHLPGQVGAESMSDELLRRILLQIFNFLRVICWNQTSAKRRTQWQLIAWLSDDPFSVVSGGTKEAEMARAPGS